MVKKMNKKNKLQGHKKHVVQNDDGKSDHNSNEEVKEDFISNMPDDILSNILSLVLLDSAVQTAALSTRWSEFWNKTETLKSLDASKQQIARFVLNFVFEFYFQCPFQKPRKLHISYGDGLILIASLGLKSKLLLDFSKGKLDFPKDFEWELKLNKFPLIHPPVFAIDLELAYINYLTKKLASCMPDHFRLIESLTIRKCEGLRSLRLIAARKLRNLTIFDCSGLKSLVVKVHFLRSFRYRGPLGWFKLEHVSILVDVMLECREGPGYDELRNQDFNSLFKSMIFAKILTLSGWIFKEIMMPWMCNEHENFTELEELWWIDSSGQNTEEALMSFLQFSPNLERLFITIDPSSFNSEPSKMASNNKAIKSAKLRHLKLVMLEGFADDGDDEEMIISLGERLFDMFNVEPRMIIATKGSQPRRLVRIPKHKGKRNPSKKVSHKFVEEIEDNAGLYSPHIHMCL